MEIVSNLRKAVIVLAVCLCLCFISSSAFQIIARQPRGRLLPSPHPPSNELLILTNSHAFPSRLTLSLSRKEGQKGDEISNSKSPSKKLSKSEMSPKSASKKQPKNKKRNSGKPKKPKNKDAKELISKEDLIKAVGEEMRSKKASLPEGENLLDRINPFKVGRALRDTIDTAVTSISTTQAEERSKYYLDDRLLDIDAESFSEDSTVSLEDRLSQEKYIPEVLVVGATGGVGIRVVRRMLLDGRFRVRVLVQDLYSKTLNLLGTGVTYCQGNLANFDSLEYAVTDVDKIVFCAGPPKPDEEKFQQKFQDFMKENLESRGEAVESLQQQIMSEATPKDNNAQSDTEWEQLEKVLEVRARLAEQVDCIGMQNLVAAYQNVRHADYGTSQAAKRSLFKFQDRPEDFNFFGLDDSEELGEEGSNQKDLDSTSDGPLTGNNSDRDHGDEGDLDYEDDYDDYDDEYATEDIEQRRDASVKAQCQWMRNRFEHGVFRGKIPKAATASVIGGEAAIISSRFRSRDDPDNGIDLGRGSFAGFICRVCSDGGTYEAFVRTGAYYSDGVEYVCEFSTSSKPIGRNKSPNKFVTVRLPFDKFKPVNRRSSRSDNDGEGGAIPPFRGRDVRNLGFRYRSASNRLKSKLQPGEWNSFYLALCYIKLYRSQPEPEFVYLSDARIPPVVKSGMVRHNAKQIVSTTASADGKLRILDESALTASQDRMSRSPEETYYKYRGEEILKSSGLSYAVVRVNGYNESPSGEASTIELKTSNDVVIPVARDEVAQVCVSALLDPSALNKSFYVSKKGGKSYRMDENIHSKFDSLPTDSVI